MPYVVDGFHEVSEAVRRGHSVLLVRERCEVADGVVVFDETHGGSVHPSIPITRPQASPRQPLVSVVRFDPATARYEMRDAVGATGAVQLTPRRLQQYLAEPKRSIGVALGS